MACSHNIRSHCMEELAMTLQEERDALWEKDLKMRRKEFGFKEFPIVALIMLAVFAISVRDDIPHWWGSVKQFLGL